LDIQMCIMQSLSQASDIPSIAKSIYLAVMTKPPRSLHDLANSTGTDYKCLRRHCAHLVDAGWLRLKRVGRLLVPCDAVPVSVEDRVADMLRNEIEVAPYRGEAVAKAIVSRIVAPRVRILFNARVEHLKSTKTGQPLEYDIYIPEWKWAGEYFGDQHFSPTKMYQDANEFAKRVQRDYEKARLSRKNGIRLSIFTKEELTIEAVDAMMPPEIPRRCYEPQGPVAHMLDELGKQVASSKDYWDRD